MITVQQLSGLINNNTFHKIEELTLFDLSSETQTQKHTTGDLLN